MSGDSRPAGAHPQRSWSTRTAPQTVVRQHQGRGRASYEEVEVHRRAVSRSGVARRGKHAHARWRATNSVKTADADRSEEEIRKKQEEAEKAKSEEAPDTLKPQRPISQQEAEAQNARRAESLERSGAEATEGAVPNAAPANESAPEPTATPATGGTP